MTLSKETFKIKREMRKKKTLSILCSLFILLGFGGGALAQITIGTGEPPVAGALLQVKNIENVGGSGTNANKGMSLPRVSLRDVNMLYPMFTEGYDKGYQDAIHAGLVVFNTNATLKDGNGLGIYFWNGKLWRPLTGDDGNNIIEVTPSNIFLSEVKSSDKAILTTSKSGQAWNMTSSGLDGSSTIKTLQNGKSSRLTFTRSTTIFGDKTYTFKLVDKPDIQAQILVSNLELKINKEIFRVGEGSVNGVVNSSTAIEPIGGDVNWELVDYSKETFNWTIPPKNDRGHLVFELGTVKVGGQNATGSVFGEIRVRHINEPGLIRTIKIEQNKEYRVLPPFDYMVIKYGPGGVINSNVDIDSATEILKSNVSAVDKKPVGFISSAIGSQTVGGIAYMFYAGDERKTGSETSYVNIPKLNDILVKYPNSSNQIEIGMSAWWYEINSSTAKEAMVTISLYKGGIMVQNGTTFENKVDGVKQLPLLEFSSGIKTIAIRGAEGATLSNYKTKYTPMFKLEYDRKDNTGVLIQWRNWE